MYHNYVHSKVNGKKLPGTYLPIGMLGSTATDLLDIPRQTTCMNPACTCRIV